MVGYQLSKHTAAARVRNELNFVFLTVGLHTIELQLFGRSLWYI